MRYLPFATVIFVLGMFTAVTASAACTPIKADIVSLGEKPARAYAVLSMTRQIESEKDLIEATGKKVTRVTEPVYDCKPFPNIIGADEWRCTASARVCAK